MRLRWIAGSIVVTSFWTISAFADPICGTALVTAEDKTKAPSERRTAARAALLCAQQPLPIGKSENGELQLDEAPFNALEAQSNVQRALDAEADAASAQSFETKLGFGMGVGFSWGRGSERVEEANVVNGVVRVERAETDKPRIFLEAHKFLWNRRVPDIGIGPFVSVQSGGEDALSSWGAGLMIGFRDDAKQGDGLTSWNLGVGYLWDADVKTLGDGIEANAPLPEGETEIRYKNSSAGSVFVVFSRNF